MGPDSDAPRPRRGPRPAALWYAAVLAFFLWSAWARVAVQNAYHRGTIETFIPLAGQPLWTNLRLAYKDRYYPPVHRGLVVLAMHAVGADPAAITRAFWLIPVGTSLLVVLFYRLRGRPALGWFAGAAYLLLPFAWEGAVFPVYDYSLTIFVAASFVLLEIARRRGGSLDVALGACLGLGFLVKWTFGLFAGPWALAYALAGRRPPTATAWKRQAATFLRVAAGFLPLVLPWYAFQLNWHAFLPTVGNSADPRFGIFNATFPDSLGGMLGPPPAWSVALVAALLLALLLQKGEAGVERDDRVYAVAAGLLPLGCMLVLPHVEERYLSGLVVAVMLAPAFFSPARLMRFVAGGFLAAVMAGAILGTVAPDLRHLRNVRADPRRAESPWYNPGAARAEAWFAGLAARDRDLPIRGVRPHPLYRSQLLPPEDSLGTILYRAGRIPLHMSDIFSYADFARDLRQGGQRDAYLLTNCRDAPGCVRPNRERYRYVTAMTSADHPFHEPGSGRVPTSVGAEPLGADWPAITAAFDLIGQAEIGKETWYLWRPKTGPVAGPTDPEKKP